MVNLSDSGLALTHGVVTIRPMGFIGALFNPNISYMVQNIHYDILCGIAEGILDELYDVVVQRPEMMVCDWRAYAILEAYRQYADLLEPIQIPDIEECFSGSATPAQLYLNDTWCVLSELHEIHWRRSRCKDFAPIYESYLNCSRLVLEHYILTL